MTRTSTSGTDYDGNPTTNLDLVKEDHGMKRFLLKSYLCSGAGIVATVAAGPSMAYFFRVLPSSNACLAGGLVAMGASVAFKAYPTTVKSEIVQDTDVWFEYHYSENSLSRQIAYGAIIGGMSLAVAPLTITLSHEKLMAPTLVTTSCLFGGASLYAYYAKPADLVHWKSALSSGLAGLFGCSLAGLGAYMTFGRNGFTDALSNLRLYAGLPLFMGLVAYDTHRGIQMYREERNPDHLGLAAEMYLDFISLFVRIGEIWLTAKKKREEEEDDEGQRGGSRGSGGKRGRQ